MDFNLTGIYKESLSPYRKIYNKSIVKYRKIELLFTRYIQNQCSLEEKKLLFKYFGGEENESILKNLIKAELESLYDMDIAKPNARLEKIFQDIKKIIQQNK